MRRSSIDFKSFLQIVKEFFKAIVQRRTYSIHKNWYCFFGILWGIPIPIVTVGIDLYSSGLAADISSVIRIISSHPFHFFFLLHPLFFGIVFGAMGTVRYNKEQKIEESEKNLINKNLELELLNKRLRKLDSIKSDFLSMVSHELRTPLTTIQGYISYLRTEKPGTLNAGQKECLQISEETSEHLNYLIEELLNLSKIEIGEFKVNLTAVNMNEIMERAIASLRLFADKQGITLQNNLPCDLPLVSADKERILQVITNLLENAIKFNKQGGKVSVSAFSDKQNNKVTFCVSDTGIGIAADKIDKIFDKFYQVDSSEKRKYGGLGVGLSISKSILELHKGRLWVESKLGEGSSFSFELPAAL